MGSGKNTKREVVRRKVINRGYEGNLKYIEKDPERENAYTIKIGFVPSMRVPAKFYTNEELLPVLLGELKEFIKEEREGFLPSLVQIANVATLPGIVRHSFGLPDIHSGYGFAVGNCAAFDMDDSDAIVSPGGIGFDIGCGVRMVRTNLTLVDLAGKQHELGKEIEKVIPAGVFKNNERGVNDEEINRVLKDGMKWALEKGFCWEEDLAVCEDFGCVALADPSSVSPSAKARGAKQLGTLGSGNHYVEVQAVTDIFDEEKAAAMGITQLEQLCVMVHTGSRGFGHKVCSDMTAKVAQSTTDEYNDRQLSGVRISSELGKTYLAQMACAINFAYTNRTVIVHRLRKVFEKVFGRTAKEMEMEVIYDVSHNTAKVEEHVVDGKKKNLLVHRKGATRSFGPGDERVPEKYRGIGQPVLIGGSMGTCSYVLVGTDSCMKETFGTTCHGAGRVMSRKKAAETVGYKELQKRLARDGIFVAAGYGEDAEKGLVEEAPEAYKDVEEVIKVCQNAGLNEAVFKIKPVCVIKGN
ncbi:MAG: RtcB-like protein [Amphiamblys sp. WSBS2006]|nr:MAG: RtcB-like protein [Amphiamblys sp. WSBS2006]